jgi:preprotein translocase subunit SecD
MNRYPLWKNLLVFGVVILATIVALPNFFGDDEAVQVSRTDGVAIDAPALEQMRMALTEGGVQFMSAEIEGISALVRLDTAQQQETARDVLAKALPNHVVALTLSPRTPGWLKALGLELGVHFLTCNL